MVVKKFVDLQRGNYVSQMFRAVEYESKNLHVFVDHGERVPTEVTLGQPTRWKHD